MPSQQIHGKKKKKKTWLEVHVRKKGAVSSAPRLIVQQCPHCNHSHHQWAPGTDIMKIMT